MPRYLFAEIALSKRAYRLLAVVETTAERAWKRLPTWFGIAYIGMRPVAAKVKPGVRTRLYRDRVQWDTFLDRFSLSADIVDQWMDEALYRQGPRV